MKMIITMGKFQIAGLIFWVNAVAMVIIGVAFVLAKQFLPFHSDVINAAWNDLDPSFQALLLGMMRTEGAGYLAAGGAMAILLAIPLRARQRWAIWAIVSIGLIEHLPTFLATFHVSQTTAASPPWGFIGLLMISMLLGLLLALSAAFR